MDPFSIGMTIASSLPALLDLFRGDDAINSPELNRLLQMQLQRMRGQNPMYESIAKLAFSRMPTGSRQGLAAPSWADAQSQVPPTHMDGESDLPPELREILRTQETRMHLTNPLYQAIQSLVGSRMPMGLQPPPGTWQGSGSGSGNTGGGPGGGGSGDGTPPPPPPTDPDIPNWLARFSNAPASDPWNPDYRPYY